jgi:hypothetical protein
MKLKENAKKEDPRSIWEQQVKRCHAEGRKNMEGNQGQETDSWRGLIAR